MSRRLSTISASSTHSIFETLLYNDVNDDIPLLPRHKEQDRRLSIASASSNSSVESTTAKFANALKDATIAEEVDEQELIIKNIYTGGTKNFDDIFLDLHSLTSESEVDSIAEDELVEKFFTRSQSEILVRPKNLSPTPALSPSTLGGGGSSTGYSDTTSVTQELLSPNTKAVRHTTSVASGISRSQSVMDFESIDFHFNHTYNEEKKQGWWGVLRPWVILFILGSLTAIVASMIDIGAGVLATWREGYCTYNVFLQRDLCCADKIACNEWIDWENSPIVQSLPLSPHTMQYIIYVVASLVFVWIAATLVRDLAPFAAGSGIPETKSVLAGFRLKGFLGLWSLVVKTVGIVFCVSAGLSLGKEGPTVSISSALSSSVVMRLFRVKNEVVKREFISAATAAGVCVAFNGAPIGGILFMIEEASTYFQHKVLFYSFFASIVSDTVFHIINPTHSRSIALIPLKFTAAFSFDSLFYYVFIGIVMGIAGAMFIKVNVLWTRYIRKDKISKFPVLEVMCISLLTSILAYPYLLTRGTLHHMLDIVLSGCDGETSDTVLLMLCDTHRSSENVIMLLIAFAIIFLTTAITFGSRIPSGLFIPCLLMGAFFGRITTLFNTTSDAYFFPLVGAISFLSSVTKMTVSICVIVIEMTDSIDLAPALLIGAFVSKWIADRFDHDSIYEHHMRINNVPYLTNELASEDFPVTEFIKGKRTVALKAFGETVISIRSLLTQTSVKGFPVVTDENIVIGWIERSTLEKKIDSVNQSLHTHSIRFVNGRIPAQYMDFNFISFSSIVDSSPPQIVPLTTASRLLRIFSQLGCRVVLVVEQGTLRGVITRNDLLRYQKMYEDGHNFL
ncbi:hypothetical protein PCE1_002777 [Barthelona sp. PCE]